MSRSPIRFLLALALCVVTVVTCRAQGFSDVQIETTHVAGKVYLLKGRGGNIGVSVGEDGILIIDDQFAPLADKIRAALKELGPGAPKLLLNTHWHGDHTGGNAAFGRDATIIAHANVRARLSTKQEMRGRTFEARPKEALPVITFEESLSVHFNGEEIRALHVPNAHTDGDTAILFTESRVLHCGDLFFNERFPFVDVASGGSVPGLIDGIATLLRWAPADAKVIPGHGELSDRAGLETYNRMLLETREHVRRAVAAGRSLEEIQAAGVPEEWKSWGEGWIKTDQWLSVVHRSLQDGGQPEG